MTFEYYVYYVVLCVLCHIMTTCKITHENVTRLEYL